MDAKEWKDDIWKTLKRGSADGKHPFHYLYLGTTGYKGPQQRTIILRKVDIPNARLYFYSDERTQKIRDIRQKPKASLLAYHPKQMLQIKLSGEIELHQAAPLAEDHWKQVPESHYSDYNSAQAPGTPLEDPDKIERKGTGKDNFIVLEFRTLALDALQLSREGHKRIKFRYQEGNWDGSFVIP